MTTSHKTKWREARIRIPKIGGEMMQGSEPIDNLMMPVLVAIKRHIENQDAITDIYNRAYEALMIGMDVNSDRVKELEKELAALKQALDISHKNHDRCNRDYVLLKKHLDGINRAVDVLGPKVARAITKLTPPSITDAYLADHQFARELRAALDDVTDAQNTVYKPEAE